MKFIYRFNSEDEFYIEEGCYIIELLNDDNDEKCSIARARVKPCTTTELHYLNTIERYVILEGEGKVEIDNLDPVLVKPLDVILIPPKTPQKITNSSLSSDLVFLCICTPRFIPNMYQVVKE